MSNVNSQTVYTTDKGAVLFTDKDQSVNSQDSIVTLTIVEAFVLQKLKTKMFSLGIVLNKLGKRSDHFNKCYIFGRHLTLKVAYGNICSGEISCLNNVLGPDRALLFYIAIALNCLLATKLVCGTAGETMNKLEMNVTLGTPSVPEI